MNKADALEMSSTRSSHPAEDLKDALPTMRTFLVGNVGMPDDAIVRSVSVATKLHEDGISTYTLEVTYAG